MKENKSYTSATKLTKKESEKIYGLAKVCEIKKSEVDEAIDMLGYDTALLYTQFFVGNSLCGNLYLNGVRAITEKIVSQKELRRIVREKSDLEIAVSETVRKFNFNQKQMNQTVYERKNRLTGKKENGDSVRKGHCYEHELSRTDRGSD